MKMLKLILGFTFIGFTSFCIGQNQRLNAIELTADVGISYDLDAPVVYQTFGFFEDLVTDDRSLSRARNWSFAYTRFINPKNGIKISFGQSQFGFDFEGKLQNTGTPIRGYYRASFLEFGASYLRKIFLSSNYNLLLEPGLRYHSDASSDSNVISISEKDVFSLSGYAGLEFPMIGEKYFANIGLQFKLPLQRYNFEFEGEPPYYPYFIGIKVGVKFQFSWTKNNVSSIF